MDLFLKSHKRHRNIFLHKSYFSDSKRINMLIIINHIQFFYYSSYYINMKHSYLPQMNKPELEDEILINRAEVFGVMGMYNEAEIELNKVNLGKITNPGLIGYYYRTRRAYYGWLADYTADIKASKYYKKITETYRDSISMMKLPDMDSQINNAEELIING